MIECKKKEIAEVGRDFFEWLKFTEDNFENII